MGSIDLPAPLRDWVESATGSSLVSAARHFAGASRDAWNVDIAKNDEVRPLFLLSDKGRGEGSARDASVLCALAGSPIPVPKVVARDEALGALLLERIPGRSDFPSVDHESEREPTARHLMELTGRLHRLDPGSLRIPHLSLPISAADCARGPLEQAKNAASALGEAADPFFSFALGWLERNVPLRVSQIALVHSDMGPGNFLFQAGRVTGIVDWEVAHFGDPMEDLAAIAVRDMATPIGHLPTRLEQYQASCGTEVDLERVGYYRALVLTRNSLMIGLGLAHPPPSFDVVEMTMYQTLLMRGAALVLCDNLGLSRPGVPDVDSVVVEVGERSRMIAALRRDLAETIVPALGEGLAARRADGIARALETLDHEDRVGGFLDEQEQDDLMSLLGERPSDPVAGERALREALESIATPDARQERRFASYFARRLTRLAERRRPLMGPLWERLPQPLEDA